MKIALVHDYLAQDGGAERVLQALHELWPEAPIFVLFHDPKKITSFNTKNIQQSFLGRMPFINSRFQWYLPFMPMATERHNLRDFDIVISSSSSFAKGIITHPGTLHISYCHTPARYIWFDSHKYVSDLPTNPFVKAILPLLLHRLRLWDQMSAQRVDHFIANSKTVQQRIHKYYRRDSDVIHPPVEIKLCPLASNIEDYFVTGGRLVPYKRVDLVVQVFNRLKWPLKIFGAGPELERLQRMAKPNIEFLGRISDEQKALLLSKARAFIHPQIEDFGITPIETMASGRPVIAYAEGGATETVIPQETGIFFPRQSWESLLDTVIQFDWEHWDSQRIRDHALKYSTENFKSNLKRYIDHRYEEFKKGFKQESFPLSTAFQNFQFSPPKQQ